MFSLLEFLMMLATVALGGGFLGYQIRDAVACDAARHRAAPVRVADLRQSHGTACQDRVRKAGGRRP